MQPSRSLARTIYLIKRVETVIKGQLEAALRDLALTPGQYATMSLLKANNEISSAAMARRVAVSAQSMSEMIAALEKKGLVARFEKPDNRRILQIELTGAGVQLIAQCEKRVNVIEKALLVPLQVSEHDTLRTLLSRILDHAKDDYV